MENNVFWAFIAITFIVGLTLGIAVYDSSITGRALFGLFPDATDDMSDVGYNQTNCTDSDGGIVLPVKGTCKDNSGNKTDVCVNTTYLKEYFCVNATSCNWHVYNCARFNYTSCYNGACTSGNGSDVSGMVNGKAEGTTATLPAGTYQEILDMLNSCTVEYNILTNLSTCDQVCNYSGKTCIGGFLVQGQYGGPWKTEFPVECATWDQRSDASLFCRCCLPSGQAQTYGTPRSGKCESRAQFMGGCTQSSCITYCRGKCYAPGVTCSVGASCDEDVCFCECTGGGVGSG